MKLVKDISKDSPDRRICPFKTGYTCTPQCVFYDIVENYKEPHSGKKFTKAEICALANVVIRGWAEEEKPKVEKAEKVKKIGTIAKRNRKKH